MPVTSTQSMTSPRLVALRLACPSPPESGLVHLSQNPEVPLTGQRRSSLPFTAGSRLALKSGISRGRGTQLPGHAGVQTDLGRLVQAVQLA
jgi:hypothetical protein